MSPEERKQFRILYTDLMVAMVVFYMNLNLD